MIVASSSAIALGGNRVSYPKEKVAEFVLEKLDVTTLPAAIRPKREKGKKTFRDYGYAARQVDEKEAFVAATTSGAEISIRILGQESSGIYVCSKSAAKDESKEQFQRVLLLKMKDSTGLLKSKASSKEFNGCPVIGGTDDSDTTASSY
jgi:hypothetical protein